MKKAVIFIIGIFVFAVVSAFSVLSEKKVSVSGSLPAALNDTVVPVLKMYKTDVLATYYHDKFNGRKTTSGERFDNTKYTAAHKSLPFGTVVRVTNEKNGKFVDVKINDRGPFSKTLEIDLTKKAFMEIVSNKNSGTAKVKIEIIE
ncbi:septal ring lytic transglycosylase RlpA family protein [Flavobacterium alkalisoli]|uniref:Probable endolytic peptidoglycan transglycosylase RlpA n=1 Tax=Flavobacterium alkalisoli TaxID=2602769 RepID=A0A5B9FS13_9FLAO|nr:septal ring lytic transglycosylase RlpA family protein [Flavobacterium alkalisoli]QEE48901.1 septal ring lytic transglycosylase RlpA family protein [Flavobacterium alkalisoli]